MERHILESALKEAIQECTNELGWANLAEIGTALRRKGVNYGKLSSFIASFPYLLETRIDNSLNPPVVYAKLKQSFQASA
ncbi:MAG: OST-HTH/LOTUS domain-containing protein [Thermonemataceae bacterium]|nr:OST-HTH/LOTUS domain-containing protein [Thermonemataceae bacterium]